ncbi:hypothetical protein H6P81_010374 [Aristolochia fimbriata]|uniref:Uncharacterized protein n=1 Tax=Aristolochia fimbriata TaxID=158543 RepID=A0AAV7EP78_ARIFI|nr:hypothetical protein H6P81_010374 [Aristolochia fimbriata]
MERGNRVYDLLNQNNVKATFGLNALAGRSNRKTLILSFSLPTTKPRGPKSETTKIPLPPEKCVVCDSTAKEESAAHHSPRKAQVEAAEIDEDGLGSNKRQSLGNLFKESFCRATEIRPDDVPTHFKMGNALCSLGRLSEAKDCYFSALESGEMDAEVWATLLP